MRLSLRSALILLPLATGTLLVQPGCSSSEGASGSNSPAVAPPGNTTPVVQTTRVDELFEHPTQALIDALLAEHTPSEDEMNVAAVYWAGLIVGNERGQIPEAFVASGIQDDVLALASKYPSFFRLSASGLYEPAPLGIRDLHGKPAAGCAEACFTPAQAVSLGFVAFGCLGASGIASGRAVIKTGNVGIGLAQGVWSRFEKNGSNVGSNKLKAYAAAVQGDGAALTFAVVDILAAAVSFGVASGGLALSPAAFGAVLIIGGISAGLQCGSAISKASVAYSQCQSWRAANCKCTSVVCAGPAPLCIDGNAATRTESCRDSDGACVSSTTVTKVCAAPTRACNGPLLTMTTESCAGGACASNTTVVQDCATQPAKSATCASARQRTTYTPTCKTTAGTPTCDYAETTTACPAGQTCAAGICSCATTGQLCFSSNRAGSNSCSQNSSGVGVVIAYDGTMSSGLTGVGQPRDFNSFNNWCPFISGAPGVPNSEQVVPAFCGDHQITVTVSALPCSGTPEWPVTLTNAGVQFGSGATVRYVDGAGNPVVFTFNAPGSINAIARFQ